MWVFAHADVARSVEYICLVNSVNRAVMTHAGLRPEFRAHLGITDNLVRLSVGVEDLEDIIEDITQALAKAKA